MTHIVTDACIKCKYTDCVEVCPVQCFYESKLMVAIDPYECIDCGVCVPECPVGAIKEESEDLIKWSEINKKISQTGNQIIEKKPALENADEYAKENNKYEKYMRELE